MTRALSLTSSLDTVSFCSHDSCLFIFLSQGSYVCLFPSVALTHIYLFVPNLSPCRIGTRAPINKDNYSQNSTCKMAKKKSSFERFLSASRKSSSHRTRTPWRTRTKRTVIKLTPAEKAQRKIRREEEKMSYHHALMEAQTEVQKLADDLREKFGKHSSQYYLEEIMQISRLQKKRKVTGAWNAFVSMEVKHMNSGMIYNYFFLLCWTNTWNRTSGGGAEKKGQRGYRSYL